ncbi:MAG: phage terminase large subunit family protein [Lachnospiraceae bacterium]
MKSKEVSFHTLHFICSLACTLRPKEDLTVSQWADKYMVLPDGSNEAGRFNTASVPYQKEIMDAITDISVRETTIMSSAQVGKTTIILCGIGYYIDHEPSTQLMVLPTLSLGEKFSKTRLAPMIRDIPPLREKIAPAKAKDSDNTILFKQYAGGYIVVSGANSPASLSSMPIRVIWMDEVDRYPASAGGEGDPVTLAEKRATTFWNKKYIKTSTPTIAGKSRIEKEYLNGTMEEWCVECPCCGTWQPYSFKRVDFDSVSMCCEGCGELIPEMDWKEARHKWIAGHPERKKHRSFHLNELASPWVDWRDIIDEFKKAMDEYKRLHDTEKLQTFVNTTLGETWKEDGIEKEKVTKEELEERAEYYNADLPDGVLVLTASVDTQDNRLEVEVKGWARNHENWGIYKTEIYGDPERSGVWEELEDYLKTTFYFGDGRRLNIAGVGIDIGGHHTNTVYGWVRKMKSRTRVTGLRVFGLKGYAGKTGIPLLHKATVVDITADDGNGGKIVTGHTVINIIGVDAGKESITNWLTIKDAGEGYCHFPAEPGKGYGPEYFKGLLSEKQIEKKVKGVIKKVWVKTSIRNEPLDLFNYNYAVCELLNPSWDVLENKLLRGINYMDKPASKSRGRSRRKCQKGIEM